MKQITDKLIAVIVPDLPLKFMLYGRYLVMGFTTDDQLIKINKIRRGDVNGFLSIPKDFENIIGTINKDGVIDFDCEMYIEKHPNLNYKDYMISTLSLLKNGWTANWTKNIKEDSFISLLQSKEIFLEELNNEKLLILEKL